METKRVFGIDLGTTYSCIAQVDDAGQPVVISNFEGDLTTPSVVLFENDAVIVGKEAKNSAVLSSDQVVELVKRQMGDAEWRFEVDGVPLSPEEVSSHILRKVTQDAGQYTGTKVEDVVITCPAYFGVAARKATENAGIIAGLNVLEVINEPTAAAIAFGLQTDKDQVVLVYDLGGGTFDVTLLEIAGGAITVVATGGDHQLGGRDWDKRLVDYLADEWAASTGSSDDPRDDPASEQDLWLRAEEAKRSLTAKEKVKVAVNHGGQRAAVEVTREKFDELTADLLVKTVDYTRQLLTTARGLGHEKFDQLLMVGGSTKMPQVAARLRTEFGVEPVSFEPDQAVAKGAAYYGQKLAVDEEIRIIVAEKLVTEAGSVDLEQAPAEVVREATRKVATDRGLTLPAVTKMASMKVTNVTSHSFGVIALDRNTRESFISNLVLAQDKVPVSVARTFLTDEAGQREVSIQIRENGRREERVAVSEGEEIGTAMLELTPGLPEDSPIEVTFALGTDGQLTVTGRDMAAGGKDVTAVIQTARVLSREEVAEAKARSQGLRME